MCIVSVAAKGILIGSALLALMMVVSARLVKGGSEKSD